MGLVSLTAEPPGKAKEQYRQRCSHCCHCCFVMASSTEYVQLDKGEQPQDCTRAAHCMLYARSNDRLQGIYDAVAMVLMQVRFDGYLGFPGGLVEPEESVWNGLKRELQEEVCVDVDKLSTPGVGGQHVVSHWDSRQEMALHFYAFEVSCCDFQDIEKASLTAKDWGTEVMGTLRVPLYTMDDGYRGFPNFLRNRFIGNSREQLLYTLKYIGLMTQSDIQKAVDAVPSSGQ